MNWKLTVAFALVASCPLVAHSESLAVPRNDDAQRARMGEAGTKDGFKRIIDDATAVYMDIAKKADAPVPTSVLRNAKCIAVLPEVVTGAVIVGGSHGTGIASCKTTAGTWSQPVPISFEQGSFGLQLGGKSTDLVMYFQTSQAVEALKRGEFKFGSDVSAVAGTFDSSFDTADAGIVAYHRTEGLFAGASLSSGKIGRDTEELSRHYGVKADYVRLLEGRVSPDSSGYSKKLTNLFPS